MIALFACDVVRWQLAELENVFPCLAEVYSGDLGGGLRGKRSKIKLIMYVLLDTQQDRGGFLKHRISVASYSFRIRTNYGDFHFKFNVEFEPDVLAPRCRAFCTPWFLSSPRSQLSEWKTIIKLANTCKHIMAIQIKVISFNENEKSLAGFRVARSLS